MHKVVLKILSNFSPILAMFSPTYFVVVAQTKLPIQINAVQNIINPIFLLDTSTISSIKNCVPIIEINGETELAITFINKNK